MLGFMMMCGGVYAQDDSPSEREMVWGQTYNDIGTFGGYSFWMGYDGSFSETYMPESESYAWVVHFAPEGMYVSLQKSKSVYSAVDVNAGFNFFYGVVKSPDGDTISRDYFNDMLAMSFSMNNFEMSAAPMGPLSNLSIGISSSNTFFKLGSSDTLAKAFQYGTGFSTAYALVSIPIPFQVSLNNESSVEAGFYPIAAWDVDKTKADPTEAIKQGLNELANSDSKTFIGLNLKMMAGPTLKFLENSPMNSKITEFVNGGGNSEIDRLIEEVEQWKQTGDTKNLPEKLKPNIPPKEIYILMKPLQCATNAAFEVGYKRGYDSKNRDDTIYGDCVEEIKAEVGKTVTIEVKADEILSLMPELDASNLDGISVIFDNPPDSYLGSGSTETEIVMEGGKAVFEFIPNMESPMLLGVRVPRSAKTNNKNLELCRRMITF